MASDPQAKALFTDAGCQVSGGAPYYLLNGRRITIAIDHIIERQTMPRLALTASNLQGYLVLAGRLRGAAAAEPVEPVLVTLGGRVGVDLADDEWRAAGALVPRAQGEEGGKGLFHGRSEQ